LHKIRYRKIGYLLSKAMIFEILFLFCQPFGHLNRKPLKKTIITLLMGCIFLVSCKKEAIFEPLDLPQAIAIPLPCIGQTENPAGRSYDTDSLIDYSCKDKHCGMMPLSSESYWIYEDSIFDNGTFVRVQFDTLRFTSNVKSLSDGITWWNSTVYVGLPQTLYSNDSSFFGLQPRLYNPDFKDAKRDYFLFPGDSVRYLAGFGDIAAQGRSLKMNSAFKTPAGEFDEYFYFEKNARNYRKDQLYFKPGVGVLKYIQEKAPIGTRVIKLQQVMTLVAFHIE